MGIIRGTQLAGHTVRMGGQSLKDWFKFFTALWFLLIVLMLYLRIDDIHVSHIKGYGVAVWRRIGWDETKVPLINRVETEKKRAIHIKLMNVINRKPHISDQIVVYYYTPDNILINKIGKEEWIALNNIWWNSVIVSFVIASLLMAVVTFYLGRRGNKTKKDSFVRGRKITDARNLNNQILVENTKESIVSPYSIAGIAFPPRGETEHLMISGVSGTGKTVLLKDLLRQIKEKGDKAIIYDYTGAFVEVFYNPEKDIIINPFDERTKNWCLLKEASTEAEFDTIAEALIGNSDSISDPFWPNGARLIFSELCKIQFRNKNFDTQELYNHLLLPIDQINEILKDTLAQNFTDPKSTKTTLSLLMMLSTYLKGLKYIKNNDKDDFSIKKWILDPEANNMLFLSSRSSLHGSIQPLISGMMDIAINNMGELPVGHSKKTWLIFDEISSLNHLPSLEQGLTVSRNFGGCFVIAFQSLSQLIKRYGAQDAETITSNCNSKIILKAGNTETAKWASQLLGTEEIEKYREGLSYGAHEVRDGVNLSKDRVERSIVLASEILSLPKFTGYALMTGGLPVTPINFESLKYVTSPYSNVSFIKKIK